MENPSLPWEETVRVGLGLEESGQKREEGGQSCPTPLTF